MQKMSVSLFHNIFIHKIWTVVIIMAIVSFTGCAVEKSVQKSREGVNITIEQISDAEKIKVRGDIAKNLQEGLGKYRLCTGDVLEVMYHIGLTTEAEDYRLGVSDEINVEFFFHPQINRTVVIRPDGKITLPIKGDIRAAGLKPLELAAAINNQFSDILNNPQVTVMVNKYSSKIAELQKAITNSPRGQAKMMVVGPDGNIYLPLLKGVKAAGKTIDELKDSVTKEYSREFSNLQVSFLIESITGSRVFVFGEVRNPGVLTSGKPLTAVQAIASAGGILPTGSWEKVKVVHWDDKNETSLRTVNINNVVMNMKMEEDLILPANSVVFVPKTTIAKVDQFIDQYIKQVFLFTGTSVQFSRTIGPPTP